LGSSIPVLPGLFDLVHTRNRGAAFGALANLPENWRVPFFLATSLIALVLLALYFFKSSDGQTGTIAALALIFGGAAGNICDRIRLGEVIDFLSFHWFEKSAHIGLGGWHLRFRLEWPAFNVADTAITVSVLWLMILSFIPKKTEGGNP
jgi:signal peptidase II